MSKTYELVQKIEAGRYQGEAGYLKNDLSFRALVQRCQALEDALVREREVRDLVASAAGDNERSLVAAGNLIESLKEQLRKRDQS
jgi:HPt (histidine-containing phosphotransfer) domain-containing protein